MTIFAVWFSYQGDPGVMAATRPERYTYFDGLTASGHLLASGQLTESSRPAGMLLLRAADRAEATRLLDGDPFATRGLIDERRIEPWNPTTGSWIDAGA